MERSPPCSKVVRLYNVKMAILPQLTYRFNSISIKISSTFQFCSETDKTILKLTLKCKGSRIIETILKRVEKAGRLILPDLDIYAKATNQICVVLP